MASYNDNYLEKEHVWKDGGGWCSLRDETTGFEARALSKTKNIEFTVVFIGATKKSPSEKSPSEKSPMVEKS